MSLELTGKDLTIEDVVTCARDHETVTVSEDAMGRVERSRELLEERVEAGDTIYGVNTGFGDLADRSIPLEKITELQHNIARSHAAGVGDPLEEDEARAVMLLRLNSLLQGNSGVRPAVVETLVDALNADLYPHIPRKGSVGASGDLAPLAHMALALIGEGEAMQDGAWVASEEVLQRAGIEPLTLHEKEGLALVNGTNVMAALGCLAAHDSRTLLASADTAAAVSMEALEAVRDAFIPEIHELRPHPGQQETARNIRLLTDGSGLMQGSDETDRVQDSYSLRCVPQVHGASRDALDHVEEVLEREINSVTDNPLVLDDGRVVSGGNFHGQPLALALDHLTAAVSEIGSISERRTAKLVDADNNAGLPSFLVEDSGLESGLMVPQYTAAALASENRVLSHPSSTDTVPTSANQEDHVSMGMNGANHLCEVIGNVRTILAVELLTGTQGLHLRDGEPGNGTAAAHDIVRDRIEPVTGDRRFGPDIEELDELIRDGAFRGLVEDLHDQD